MVSTMLIFHLMYKSNMYIKNYDFIHLINKQFSNSKSNTYNIDLHKKSDVTIKILENWLVRHKIDLNKAM